MRISYPIFFAILFLAAYAGKSFLAEELSSVRSQMEPRVVAEVQ